MEFNEIQQKANNVYNLFRPLIKAIYYGGSRVVSYIQHPHDYDFIMFANNMQDCLKLRIYFNKYKKAHPDLFDEKECWLQIRPADKTEYKSWSYLYNNMILLCGTSIQFEFDPINNITHKNKYIKVLKENITQNLNRKRIYHFYRGYLLVTKGTYDLTEEEIENLNILHDQKLEDYEKIQTLQKELKYNILRLNYASN